MVPVLTVASFILPISTNRTRAASAGVPQFELACLAQPFPERRCRKAGSMKRAHKDFPTTGLNKLQQKPHWFCLHTKAFEVIQMSKAQSQTPLHLRAASQDTATSKTSINYCKKNINRIVLKKKWGLSENSLKRYEILLELSVSLSTFT